MRRSLWAPKSLSPEREKGRGGYDVTQRVSRVPVQTLSNIKRESEMLVNQNRFGWEQEVTTMRRFLKGFLKDTWDLKFINTGSNEAKYMGKNLLRSQ